MKDNEKVAVIGAGITGITTAYQLYRKGAAVTVFEANPYPAMETSYANGGQLSASNAEVWNSVPTMIKGVQWMFSAGAPLLMNPKPSWHKYSWLAEFVSAIPKYEANTIQTVKWALDARRQLLEMAEAENTTTYMDHLLEFASFQPGLIESAIPGLRTFLVDVNVIPLALCLHHRHDHFEPLL